MPLLPLIHFTKYVAAHSVRPVPSIAHDVATPHLFDFAIPGTATERRRFGYRKSEVQSRTEARRAIPQIPPKRPDRRQQLIASMVVQGLAHDISHCFCPWISTAPTLDRTACLAGTFLSTVWLHSQDSLARTFIYQSRVQFDMGTLQVCTRTLRLQPVLDGLLGIPFFSGSGLSSLPDGGHCDPSQFCNTLLQKVA
jgi:hypothetical protein